MSDDFYPFVDSGDPAPDNAHLTGDNKSADNNTESAEHAAEFSTRIAIYDDMLSTPRVIVISPAPVRTYLEEITNTVYRCMKEQGGQISLMVIREIVENFIHAHFVEPIISILDGGNTIRFADQGPGIEDKERAFEFGVTSADREQKRYIRGTGAGFPMVQQYLENAGGAVSIEDNLGQGTVVTVSLDPARVAEIGAVANRGGAVRSGAGTAFGAASQQAASTGMQMPQQIPQQMPQYQQYGAQPAYMPQQQMPMGQQQQPWNPYGYQQPAMPMYQQPMGQQWGTYQQYPNYQQPVGAAPFSQAAPQVPAGGVYISERGGQILTFLLQHGTCGPTELTRAFGSSVSTWTRELDTLQESGFVVKRGQKRVLTETGRAWIDERMNQGGVNNG